MANGWVKRGVVAGVALGSAWATVGAMPPALRADEKTVPLPAALHYYEPVRQKVTPEKLSVDLCVYGGTSAGVAAAVQAARDGRKVVLVAPEAHLGGLTTGGLTYTDFGNKGSIGGLSREFYQRLGKKYGVEAEWKFEPKVAEQVYQEMITEAKVPVRSRHFLKSIVRRDHRIVSLTTERGLTVDAKMFIDATYEGDLMAKAKVSYTVGREANSQYGEKVNGVQVRDKHQFEYPVSPYVVEGDPNSGYLPGINPEPVAPNGTGDHRVQAYNFRLTLTKDPKNWLPYPKPEGYDPKEYELLGRYVKHDTQFLFGKYDLLQNGKYDKNNHGAFSTDYIGESYKWPDADYREREKIFRKHVVYQQGLMWFITHDPRVPEDVRNRLAEWGLCKDEFIDTGGWSRQLYIREARRMVSDYVLTEHDCRGERKAEDPVGLGSYGMDSHNCQRVVIFGSVRNEGDVQAGGFAPYPVSYRAIVPKRGECENLLVPVCVSCSHIAYGSVRMEPVFMLLSQSAAVAAELAMDGDGVVQNVPYDKLRARLDQLGQVLEWKAGTGSAAAVAPATLPGIVLDDADGKKSGAWQVSSRSGDRKVGTGYLHDGNANKGQASITFAPELPSDGEYEIVVIAPSNPNRASNVPVTIAVEGAEKVEKLVDQRGEDNARSFVSLGRYRLPKGRKTSVTLSNRDTNGYVVIDGLQFIPR
jgi:hypothetical protein